MVHILLHSEFLDTLLKVFLYFHSHGILTVGLCMLLVVKESKFILEMMSVEQESSEIAGWPQWKYFCAFWWLHMS